MFPLWEQWGITQPEIAEAFEAGRHAVREVIRSQCLRQSDKPAAMIAPRPIANFQT
ncbi:MAG: hypothetical protein HY027_26495 [Deltaproteobacteria bacterium]|nr:hypothetical protein [Deltaproteobacteria bacterium]